MNNNYEEMEFEVQITDDNGCLDGYTYTGFDTAKVEFRKAIVERLSGEMDKYLSLIKEYCGEKYPEAMPIEISNLIDLLEGVSSNADYVADKSKNYAFDDGNVVITVEDTVLSVTTQGDAAEKFPVLEFNAFEVTDPDNSYGFSISDESFLGGLSTIEITMKKAKDFVFEDEDEFAFDESDDAEISDKDASSGKTYYVALNDGENEWGSFCHSLTEAKIKFREELSEELKTKISYYTEIIREYGERYYPDGIPEELNKLIKFLKKFVTDATFPESEEQIDLNDFEDERIDIIFKSPFREEELWVNASEDFVDEFPHIEMKCLDMSDPDEEYFFYISDGNQENVFDLQMN